MTKHFKKLGQNLFCQDFLIQSALNHTPQFLKELNKIVKFKELWRQKLLFAYKGSAEIGQPPYAPELMLKMLFLSYLFNLTERETERMINDSISMKSFLGLALDEACPDHSTVTIFKNRILAYEKLHGKNIFKEIFDEIIIFAHEKGVNLEYTQIIDSTHTVADVNIAKERQRTKPISENGQGKKERDPSAKWGVKRIKEIKTIEGKKVKVKESYFGYKNHFSVNAETSLITSYKTTAMNYSDNNAFLPLLLDDIAKGIAIPEKTIYPADRAYDDGELHSWLNKYHLKDAISLKYIKPEEMIDNKRVKVRWKQYTNQEEFEAGLKKRYIVERVNGDCKKHHNLGQARYLGLEKMNIQTAFTALAHNLKTLVKLLTGVGFRTYSTSRVS